MTGAFKAKEGNELASQLRMAANTGDKHLMANMIRTNLIMAQNAIAPTQEAAGQAST
jgi:hypothetical protein